MGYHVSILKTEKGVSVPLSELEIHQKIKALSKFRYENKTILRDGNFFLSFDNGKLWLKNPEVEDIDDMLTIANKLGARVRGDEYETYKTSNESYIHPDDIHLIEKTRDISKELRSKSRKSTIILNLCIFGIFIILIVVFHFLGWIK